MGEGLDSAGMGAEAVAKAEEALPASTIPAAPAISGPADVFTDPRAWSAFTGAPDLPAFLNAWLALEARMTRGVAAGAVFALVRVEGGDGPDSAFAPVATWPSPALDLTMLRPAAEAAAKMGGVHLERSADKQMTVLAVPIERDGQPELVVTLALPGTGGRDIRTASRRLHWGAGWLVARLAEQSVLEARSFVRRAQTTLDLLAVGNEHVRYEAAAMAIANELQTLLDLASVSIGLVRGRGRSLRVRTVALSRAAWFRRRSALVTSLENAMGEALDQSTSIALPEPDGAMRRIAVAHKAYAQLAGMGAVATFVLYNEAGPCGALTLERRDQTPWSSETLALGDAIGTVIGPALTLKRAQRRWLSGRLIDGIAGGIRALFGHRRPSLKLAALALAGFAVYAFMMPADFRISADAVLEGSVHRAAVTPFQGFIAKAEVRAGDMVTAGQELARLDDSDLRLEAVRWQSEYARLVQQQRAALAQMDRAEVALLMAQTDQARAQLELAQARLARTTIVSPIDGVVISGDLSQRLGAPIDQGEVLFEIAPLDEYRIAIQVPEADLRHIALGQSGELLLAGRADANLPLTVTRITSVADVVDGRNVFRVEARLDEAMQGLRPGMEGVVKIRVGEASSAWIWTHPLVDWARLTFWQWTP